MENTRDAERVGILTVSILRPQVQMGDLVRCPDGKEPFSGAIVDVCLGARFLNSLITMHNVHM